MNTGLPIAVLVAALLAACQPQNEPADAADATAPVAVDQPAADVPPATAPAPVEPAMPADAATPETGQARYDGYGDIKFGTAAADMEQVWGGELTEVGKDYNETCYFMTPTWVKVPSEFNFMIGDGKFVRYSTESEKFVAPGGGKVGMGSDEIKVAYAGRVEEQPHKYVEGGKNLRIKADDGASALIYEVDAGGKVTAWRVGVPPQVDYVEGCS